MRDDELLTAYLDGVAELTPEERRRVEATLDPAAADATRAVLGQLRALPADTGDEPDWTAMERSISLAVGQRVPRPWWRWSWKWALPVVACGAALAVVLAVSRPEPAAPTPVAHAEPPKPAPVETPAPAAPLVYLDGQALDIDAVDPAALDDADPVVADEDSLLPTEQWIDRLDDRALDRAEHLLAKRKKS
jgi:hypothetical protein